MEVIKMKKLIALLLCSLICLSLVDCKATSLDTTKLDTSSSNNDALIKEAVSKYYLTQDPKNKGELKIYNTKSFKDTYLVLAEKYSGDGHRTTDLLLLDMKHNIKAWTTGATPISMCFSVNKTEYDGSTILFGTFNSTKWDPKEDKKIPVQINKLDIKFSDNQSLKEDVSNYSGYIVISTSTSKLEQFNLYNNKNELQSNLDEMNEVNETKFNEFKSK
jgi:hypothetical protein